MFRGFFARMRRTPIPYHAKLDTPLLKFGARDRFTIRDACQSVQIFGGTGSGKTSGSGKALAHAYLESGMGGLVLCAKPDEAARWRRYAKQAGRSASVITFNASGKHRFNFLDYAQATIARDGFEKNLIDLIARITEAASVASGQGDGDNRFFRDAAMEMLSHVFPLLQAAYSRLRLRDVMKLIDSAPKSSAEAYSEAWKRTSFCAQTLLLAGMATERHSDARQQATVEYHGDYWIDRFPALGDRTRSSIVATLTSVLYPFLSGKLHELLCTDTTIVPEMTAEGAIIILDLPVKEFGETGAVAQQIFKYLWQLSMEARNTAKSDRPVFLWADECQFFVNSYDAEFLSTARSARACTVYITQDLPTYYAQLGGGAGAKANADALIGKFQTRIFHANIDVETNEYAANTIGKVTKHEKTTQVSSGTTSGMSGSQSHMDFNYGGNSSDNRSVSDSYRTYQDYDVPPNYFTDKLRTGAWRNWFKVDAILISSGKTWRQSKSNRIKVAFGQEWRIFSI